MLTTKAVIQKIDLPSGRVRLFQNFDLKSPWSYETSRMLLREDSNREIFPFVFHGSENLTMSQTGRETKLHISSDGKVLFADDYGVPAGFVIGVLFPEGYTPEIFKFKSKPFIPTGVGIGGASMCPPGYFDVYYNRPAKLAAVVFMITEATYFGFKCVARKCNGDFPSGGELPFLVHLGFLWVKGKFRTVALRRKPCFASLPRCGISANSGPMRVCKVFSEMAQRNFSKMQEYLPTENPDEPHFLAIYMQHWQQAKLILCTYLPPIC